MYLLIIIDLFTNIKDVQPFLKQNDYLIIIMIYYIYK